MHRSIIYIVIHQDVSGSMGTSRHDSQELFIGVTSHFRALEIRLLEENRGASAPSELRGTLLGCDDILIGRCLSSCLQAPRDGLKFLEEESTSPRGDSIEFG
jgi:hypothetical protein